jgi:hypothetical protein
MYGHELTNDMHIYQAKLAKEEWAVVEFCQ